MHYDNVVQVGQVIHTHICAEGAEGPPVGTSDKWYAVLAAWTQQSHSQCYVPESHKGGLLIGPTSTGP